MELKLVYISLYSSLLPLSIGLLKRKNLTKIDIVILILAACSFAGDFASRHIVLPSGSNYGIINLYILLEIPIVGYFFYLLLSKKNLTKVIYSLTQVTFIIVIVINGFNTYHSVFIGIYSLFVLAFCIALFYKIYDDEKLLYLERLNIFWYNTALFTFFGGSLFTDLLSQVILNGPMLWIFIPISNFLKNILLSVGLWKIQRS